MDTDTRTALLATADRIEAAVASLERRADDLEHRVYRLELLATAQAGSIQGVGLAVAPDTTEVDA